MTPQESTVSREELKSLIDDLSDNELDAVRHYIQSLHPSADPVASFLEDVPLDDELVTDDDLSAINVSRDYRQRAGRSTLQPSPIMRVGGLRCISVLRSDSPLGADVPGWTWSSAAPTTARRSHPPPSRLQAG